MWIGLYTKLGRRNIIKIREEIKQANVNISSYDAMKSFQNKIINSEEEHHKYVMKFPDFYNRSMLRDMLFHVQEHHFTIPQIKASLSQLGLVFCGFEHRDIVQEFKESRNFEENTLCDLDKWDTFEKENPDVFAWMYQFFCQKV